MTGFLRRKEAAEYVRNSWNVPCATSYLAKLYCHGKGPVVRCKIGRTPLYAREDLDNWVFSRMSGPTSSSSSVAKPVTEDTIGDVLEGLDAGDFSDDPDHQLSGDEITRPLEDQVDFGDPAVIKNPVKTIS